MTSCSTETLKIPVHGSEQKYDRLSEIVDLDLDPFAVGDGFGRAHHLVELVGEGFAHLLSAFEVPAGAVLDRPGCDVADRVELDPTRLEQLREVEEGHDLSDVFAHHDIDGNDLDVRQVSAPLGEVEQVARDPSELVTAADAV